MGLGQAQDSHVPRAYMKGMHLESCTCVYASTCEGSSVHRWTWGCWEPGRATSHRQEDHEACNLLGTLHLPLA